MVSVIQTVNLKKSYMMGDVSVRALCGINLKSRGG